MKRYQICEGMELTHEPNGSSMLTIRGRQVAPLSSQDLEALRDQLCNLPIQNARTRRGYEALCREESRSILRTADGQRNALISYLRVGSRILSAADCRRVLKALPVPADKDKAAVLLDLVEKCPVSLTVARGLPVGLVLSYRDPNGKVRIGWSFYHRSRESLPPSKHIGIVRAARTSRDLAVLLDNFTRHSRQEVLEKDLLTAKDAYFDVIKPLRPLWLHMVKQAAHYFGLVPKPAPVEEVAT